MQRLRSLQRVIKSTQAVIYTPTINTVEVPTALVSKMIKEIGCSCSPSHLPPDPSEIDTGCHLQCHLLSGSGEGIPSHTHPHQEGMGLKRALTHILSLLRKTLPPSSSPTTCTEITISWQPKDEHANLVGICIFMSYNTKWVHSGLRFPKIMHASEGNALSSYLASSLSKNIMQNVFLPY